MNPLAEKIILNLSPETNKDTHNHHSHTQKKKKKKKNQQPKL